MTLQAVSPTTSAPNSTTAQADTLLAKWVRLYDQLEAARALLKAAAPGSAEADEHEAEVRRLQRLAGVALEMVAAEQRRQRDRAQG